MFSFLHPWQQLELSFYLVVSWSTAVNRRLQQHYSHCAAFRAGTRSGEIIGPTVWCNVAYFILKANMKWTNTCFYVLCWIELGWLFFCSRFILVHTLHSEKKSPKVPCKNSSIFWGFVYVVHSSSLCPITSKPVLLNIDLTTASLTGWKNDIRSKIVAFDCSYIVCWFMERSYRITRRSRFN